MSARQEILEFMRSRTYRPMTFEELVQEFGLARKDREPFAQLLAELEKDGAIVKTRKDRYGIPERMNLVLGVLQGHRKGFAFLLPEDPEQPDIYVGMENMNGAMHRDRVIVRRLKGSRGEKEEGEVIRILERANEKVVGRLDIVRNIGFVVPDDPRVYYDVFLPPNGIKDARQGDKVIVKIEKWPEGRRNPEGRLIQVLGGEEEPGVDIESLIYRLGLPRGFSRKVQEESQKISGKIAKDIREKRLDLTDRLIFTIDGEEAKDFDDAVSLELIGNGQARLGIHIADVAHYVREGTELDREARDRGTSIYLVDRVIPMLPEKISNEVCSLQPHEERLTLSLLLDMDLDTGEVIDYNFEESIIESKYRLTYTEVNKALENGESLWEDEELFKTLRRMEHLAHVRRKKKAERGSIDFDFPEPYLELDENGYPLDIHRRERGTGEILIEEFMVLSNEVIAEHFYWRELPFIYRIHERPDLGDIKDLNQFLHNFGFHIKEEDGAIKPRDIQAVLEKIKGREEQRLIETVVLRSMKQARYHWVNMGHFGLASENYTHFTSPIRRYPDLIVHRVLKEVMLQGSLHPNRIGQLEEILPDITRHSSDMERRAMEGERESRDMKMVEYMEKKVGEEFDGIISSVMAFGFFVELENLVEGLVHVSTLTDDYYHFLEKEYALQGERTKRLFRLGDRVRIRVDQVNRMQGEIDFTLIRD